MCLCVEEGKREKNDNDDGTLKGEGYLGWIVICKTFPVDLGNFALISSWLKQATVKEYQPITCVGSCVIQDKVINDK